MIQNAIALLFCLKYQIRERGIVTFTFTTLWNILNVRQYGFPTRLLPRVQKNLKSCKIQERLSQQKTVQLDTHHRAKIHRNLSNLNSQPQQLSINSSNLLTNFMSNYSHTVHTKIKLLEIKVISLRKSWHSLASTPILRMRGWLQ